MPNTQDTLEATVADCVCQLISEQDLDLRPEPDTPLFSSGLLDSMAMIRLVSMVERALDLRMPPALVTVERFDTIRGIAEAVRQAVRG